VFLFSLLPLPPVTMLAIVTVGLRVIIVLRPVDRSVRQGSLCMRWTADHSHRHSGDAVVVRAGMDVMLVVHARALVSTVIIVDPARHYTTMLVFIRVVTMCAKRVAEIVRRDYPCAG
jgi:hypothetical protein